VPMSSDAITSTAISVLAARTPVHWREAERLTGELIDWLASTVGLDARAHQHDSNPELDSLPEFYREPYGRMLLGFLDGVASGTTGVRMMGPGTAELRRVWVTPVARGNRLAPALLSGGIEAARSLGAERICLETASGHMDKAIAMYTRAGFRPIAPYSSLPETLPNILTLGLELG
jgi:GNAT superfamily N-acetyltransferase